MSTRYPVYERAKIKARKRRNRRAAAAASAFLVAALGVQFVSDDKNEDVSLNQPSDKENILTEAFADKEDNNSLQNLVIEVGENSYILSGEDQMNRAFSITSQYEGLEEEARLAIFMATHNDPISYDLLTRLAASESSYNNAAVSTSGARGLLQFMPSVQLESIYKYGHLLPDKHQDAVNNVERYTKRYVTVKGEKRPVLGYRIKDGANEKAVMDIIEDQYVSAILGREFLREQLTRVQNNFPSKLEGLTGAIKRKYNEDTLPNYKGRILAMEEEQSRPLVGADVKAVLFLGANGATDFLVALADPEKHGHRALDYARDATVRDNPYTFYKDGANRKHPRSIKELYDRWTNMMGDEPLPDSLKRPVQTSVASISPPNSPP
jgi:hypothetical protein